MTNLAELQELADKIERQAESLEHYAEQDGFAAKPVPSVFHLQAGHFRDYAEELRQCLLSLETETKELRRDALRFRSHLQIVPMLLGPMAWQLWRGWVDKEWLPIALNRRFTWGPKARPGEGETIAEMLLKAEEEISSGKAKQVHFVDEAPDHPRARRG